MANILGGRENKVKRKEKRKTTEAREMKSRGRSGQFYDRWMSAGRE
jgi:hypothetical protein